MHKSLTKVGLAEQKRRMGMRGVWGGFCNNLKCLDANPRWLHKDHESFYCKACASLFNRDEPGICSERHGSP